MKKAIVFLSVIYCLSCNNKHDNSRMVGLLQKISQIDDVPDNPYSAAKRVQYFDSIIKVNGSATDIDVILKYSGALIEAAQEKKSIELLENALDKLPPSETELRKNVLKSLGISWLRLGERTNCLTNHSSESCILPIKGRGVHKDKTGSINAIRIYDELLKMDSSDLESRWLINIAYMTVGDYPQGVPGNYLINFDTPDSITNVKPFVDLAMATGLNTDNLAGGAIIDDFNNDGYLDLISSSYSLKEGMHYFISNKENGFTDVTATSGIADLTGGLNMSQMDYNNDGFKDIFIMRGGWMNLFGKQPNSLLRNNGDGTFTDVTVEAGLLTFRPSQTSAWADFNNDGWIDLFIGNETVPASDIFPCEFYINNGDGTFTERTKEAGIIFFDYVKGVTTGDYNNDGLFDIFISTFDRTKVLFKNTGIKDGIPQFKDVTDESGIPRNNAKTFSTWFWDYNNDGHLDLLMCGYQFANSLSWFSAAEALNTIFPPAGRVLLYENNGDGTFREVSGKAKLNKVAFAMSSNFGDIDNDGWLDFYLGTGNPHFTSLVPNQLFRNHNGEYFEDITSPARVGNLQKGHEISIADIDNDGDQDIHIELGGSFESDHYQNSLYINPGQNDNNWIKLQLTGVKANRAAIGAKIKVFFDDNGKKRMLYRELNSGSSFGANPLLQHFGIGKATIVDKIEIVWPGSGTRQEFAVLKPNTQYAITEGNNTFSVQNINKINLPNEDSLSRSGAHSHGLEASHYH